MPRFSNEDEEDEGYNPRDQADGFYGGREDDDAFADAFAAGAAATGDVHDAAWAFLFRLQKSAARGEWDDVRQQLAAHKGDVPFHAFSRQVLRNAGIAGHLDVVETLFTRNFRLPAQDGEDMLEYFVKQAPDKAAPVIRWLLQHHYARPDEAIFAVAASGSPATMELFRGSGADIQMQGSAFSLALHSGNTDMMTYLYDHGAELYRSSVVSGLNGGIQSYQDKNRDSVAGNDLTVITAVYALHMVEDMEKQAALYTPATVLDASALQAAAKAGRFSDVVESGLPVMADDMLRENDGGASALSILAAQGSVAQAFDTRLWYSRPDDALKLYDALKALNLQNAVDPDGIAADLQRHRLKERARNAHLRLKPGS